MAPGIPKTNDNVKPLFLTVIANHISNPSGTSIQAVTTKVINQADHPLAFLDKSKGNILLVSSHQSSEKLVNACDSLLPLPSLALADTCRLMVEFCQILPDDEATTHLIMALLDKRPISAFTEELYYLDLSHTWLAYHNDTVLDIAHQWCDDNGVCYLDDS